MSHPEKLARIMEKLEDRILFDAVPDGSFLLQPEEDAPFVPVEQVRHINEVEQQSLPRELILVDENVANADEMISEILESRSGQAFEIRLLSAHEDGISQISDILASSNGSYDAIHILSHGADGMLQLGASVLNTDSLHGYTNQVVAWADSLSENADLLFYGCDLAASQSGQDFVDALSVLTGADVSASTDLTGHQTLGGDWDLEYNSGLIETSQLNLSNFWGSLNVFTIQATAQPTVNGAGGIGTSGTWSNAGFVDTDPNVDSNGDLDFDNDADMAIDIVATVVDTTGTASVDFETVSTSDPLRDDMRARVSGGGTATVRWEIFESGTTNRPTDGQISLTISDIDGSGGAPESVEGIAASLHNLSSYTVQSPTNLDISVNSDFLIAQGTQSQNDEEPSWVQFDWASANELVLTYYVYDNGTRYFNHDGDGDLVFSNPDVTATQGIDLDADNSSGAAGSNYQATYVDGSIAGVSGDVPVSVADADIAIFDLNDTTLEGATIRLTNASAGDQLNVNTTLLTDLGITALVDSSSVPGQISVTLSGTSLTENYETAIQSVTYSNVNTSFDQSYVRIIEINATDGVNVNWNRQYHDQLFDCGQRANRSC